MVESLPDCAELFMSLWALMQSAQGMHTWCEECHNTLKKGRTHLILSSIVQHVHIVFSKSSSSTSKHVNGHKVGPIKHADLMTTNYSMLSAVISGLFFYWNKRRSCAQL